MNTFFISLGIEDAILKINEIIGSSSSGECLENYNLNSPDGKRCTVLIYEKYFFRVRNFLILSIVLDEFDGKTRLHLFSGGGGTSRSNYDLGASDSFSSEIIDGLEQYKCE